MMKNILIVDRDAAAAAYTESMMEYLRVSREDLHISEFARDLKQTAEDVLEMLSSDLGTSREAFKKAFQYGYTMMMLPEEIDTLEKWSEAREDFQVVVFTAEGAPVGAFNQEVVSW